MIFKVWYAIWKSSHNNGDKKKQTKKTKKKQNKNKFLCLVAIEQTVQ